VVRDEVLAGSYECWGSRVVSGDYVLRWIKCVADGYVAECIDEGVVMEDVVCADEQADSLLELRR